MQSVLSFISDLIYFIYCSFLSIQCWRDGEEHSKRQHCWSRWTHTHWRHHLVCEFLFLSLLTYTAIKSTCSCVHLYYSIHIFCHLTQVDGVSLQGCSEQRAMEVLRRTGPLVRLRLLRKAVRLSNILPPVPPLQRLRHSHSFHEGNPYKWGLNKIQETGDLWRGNTLVQWCHGEIIFVVPEKLTNVLIINL